MSEFLATKVVGPTLVITVTGPLTQRPELTQMTSAIRAHPKLSSIVIDLSETGRMDSAGLGELVLAYGAAASQRQAMRLVAASPAIRELIRMARLDRILLFSDRLEIALQEL